MSGLCPNWILSTLTKEPHRLCFLLMRLVSGSIWYQELELREGKGRGISVWHLDCVWASTLLILRISFWWNLRELVGFRPSPRVVEVNKPNSIFCPIRMNIIITVWQPRWGFIHMPSIAWKDYLHIAKARNKSKLSYPPLRFQKWNLPTSKQSLPTYQYSPNSTILVPKASNTAEQICFRTRPSLPKRPTCRPVCSCPNPNREDGPQLDGTDWFKSPPCLEEMTPGTKFHTTRATGQTSTQAAAVRKEPPSWGIINPIKSNQINCII